MLPIKNVDKTKKLWTLHCVVSFLIILYTMNIFHTYKLGNTNMATTKKSLLKIGISRTFLLLVI